MNVRRQIRGPFTLNLLRAILMSSALVPLSALVLPACGSADSTGADGDDMVDNQGDEVRTNACPHTVCQTGVRLPITCENNACVANVCAESPQCCNTAWDESCVTAAQEICGQCGPSKKPPEPPCAHDVCSSGDKLASACDPCVTKVCLADPYCCQIAWDSSCVGQVDAVCGQACSAQPPQ